MHILTHMQIHHTHIYIFMYVYIHTFVHVQTKTKTRQAPPRGTVKKESQQKRHSTGGQQILDRTLIWETISGTKRDSRYEKASRESDRTAASVNVDQSIWDTRGVEGVRG